ncbi:TlpA disulfide reductase family protein [Deinococcus sp.]|uniref:TlpA family protein disulfide reductase n=1 Tax=Deinococcus sp. TaxID=47478 RepID=UPI0025BC2EB1|nr:TlpA disulfide reductase family protein [Deinococcus sp.]
MSRFIVPVVLLAIVALLAYGLLTPPKDPPSVLVPGKPAPTFTLTDTAGKTHDLSAYRGQPVLVNFWASWCQPCHAEAAALVQAAQQSAGKVQFLGVLYNDKTGQDRAFVQQYGVPYPTLLDPGSRVAIRYGIAQLPDTYLIGADGKIVYHHLGAVTDSPELTREFKAALQSVGGAE